MVKGLWMGERLIEPRVMASEVISADEKDGSWKPVCADSIICMVAGEVEVTVVEVVAEVTEVVEVEVVMDGVAAKVTRVFEKMLGLVA